MPKPNFADIKNNGVYTLDKSQVCVVDLTAAKTKKNILDACAAGLKLPAHFGGNWDALADCVMDEDWATASSYVIVVKGAREAAKTCAADMESLQEILQEAAETWAEDHKPFLVLMAS